MVARRKLNRRSFLAAIVGIGATTVIAGNAEAYQDQDSGPGADPLGRAGSQPQATPDERVSATRGFSLGRQPARATTASPRAQAARTARAARPTPITTPGPVDAQVLACSSMRDRQAQLSAAASTPEVQDDLARLAALIAGSC